METPLVSIVMPAFNAGKYIEAAIRSVQAQTLRDWELLVLEDGSSDDTSAIVTALAAEDPRIRLLPNGENLGVARTRNRGFDLCRGQYVALLDSDDLWHPEKLETQIGLLERSGADFTYCSYAIIDGEGKPAKADYIVPGQVTFETLLRENVIGCSTVVLRRAVVEKHRFTPDFYHEDYVLWLQLLQAGLKGVGCTQVLASWRHIANSRSFDKKNAAKNRWHIYRDYLKLPLGKAICAFAGYTVNGLKKYLS